MSAADQRTLRAALWGAAAFAAVYLLQSGMKLNGLIYDPVARRFSWGFPSGAQMRYFGDVLGASAAFALAFVLARVLPLRRPPDALVLLGAALALFALDVVFFFSRVVAAP